MSTQHREEQELQHRTQGKRLFQLDALRGIAAACVVAHHTRYAVHPYQPSLLTVPIFSGPQAVTLFFVLSGFVLALPYRSGRSSPYGTYLLRRFIRIYLPFAAAATLSILFASLFRSHGVNVSDWFNQTWHTPVTRSLLIKQYLMWPMFEFNTAFWSLRFEMQLSVVIPGIVYLLRKRSSVLWLLGAILLAFARPNVLARLNAYHLLGQTIQIGSLFVLGAFVALHQQQMQGWLRRLQGWKWIAFAVSLVFYFAYPARILRVATLLHLGNREYLVSGLGAAGVIVCALELEPFAKVLRHTVAEYLGRISYSLYLVHSIVLFALFDLLYGKIPNAAIYLLIGLGSWGFAHLFCVTVEEPSIALGQMVKKLAERDNGSSTATTSCPYCGASSLLRSTRRRVEHLLPFFRPYRCMACSHRFMLLPKQGSNPGTRAG